MADCRKQITRRVKERMHRGKFGSAAVFTTNLRVCQVICLKFMAVNGKTREGRHLHWCLCLCLRTESENCILALLFVAAGMSGIDVSRGRNGLILRVQVFPRGV